MSRPAGFSTEVREAVMARSQGNCEVLYGPACLLYVHQLHDRRRPRSGGGTRKTATNHASHALGVCWPCHGLIETHPDKALANGWIVPQGEKPASRPLLWRGKKWVLLTDAGPLVEQESLW